MDQAEIQASLQSHLDKVREILEMFPDESALAPSAQAEIRSAVKRWKLRVTTDCQWRCRWNSPQNVLESAVYFPTLDKLALASEKIDVNTKPGPGWFSALYDAEGDLEYAMHDL